MKSFSVSKDSWHYQLNFEMLKTNERFECNRHHLEIYIRSKDNFCSYWRMTLWSMFKVSVAVSFLLVCLGIILYFIYAIAYSLVYNTAAALTVIGILSVIVAIIIGLGWITSVLKRRKKEKLDKILYEGETETSLVRTKYSSWKQGICIPVEFK